MTRTTRLARRERVWRTDAQLWQRSFHALCLDCPTAVACAIAYVVANPAKYRPPRWRSR